MVRGKSAVVLDLDECLVHAVEKHFQDYGQISRQTLGRVLPLGLHDPHTPKGTGNQVWMWLIKRPGLDEFLRELEDHFDYIIIWSAGVYEYVHALCNQILKRSPKYIFTRDDLEEDENGYYKPLTVVWKKFPDIDPERTVHLDDRASNFRGNVHNGMTVHVYEPEISLEGVLEEDDELDRALEVFRTEEFRKSPVSQMNLRTILVDDPEDELPSF